VFKNATKAVVFIASALDNLVKAALGDGNFGDIIAKSFNTADNIFGGQKSTTNRGGALQREKAVKIPVSPVLTPKATKEIKKQLERTFKEVGSNGLEVSDIFTNIAKSIEVLNAQKVTGLISEFDVIKQKTDLYKNSISELLTLGFEPMNNEVVKLKTELDKLNAATLFAQIFTNTLPQIPKAIEKDAIKPIQSLGQMWSNIVKAMEDDGVNKFDNLVDLISKFSVEIAKVVEKIDGILNPIFAIAGNAIDASTQKLDNYYQNQKDNIERSVMSEEQKAEAIKRLDNEVLKEKRKIARKEAILQKAQAMYGAILSGAQAVLSALKFGPIYAGVVGALAAAQIAQIAATKLPSLAIGTDLVKQDGMAYLHKNEAVVPADVAKGGFTRGGNNEIYGKLSGIDLILSSRYANNYYNRLR
jgi:hypothetical protein